MTVKTVQLKNDKLDMAKIIWYGLIWFKTSQKPKILHARLEPHSGCLSLREQKHISVNV